MTTSYIQGSQLSLSDKAVLESLRADLLVNADNASGVQTNLDTDRGTIVADLTELRSVELAAVVDLTEIRTQLAAAVVDLGAIRSAVLAITAKLDLDGDITATDYAATCDPAALTASAPAALTIADPAALTTSA